MTLTVVEENNTVEIDEQVVMVISENPQGPRGIPGPTGGIASVVAGTNVTVDNTDPQNPVVSATPGGGGAVASVNEQTGAVVLDTDDIADTAANRYTSDADITRLAGTSGTNTGDQDLSGLVPNTRTINGAPLSSNITLDQDDVPDGATAKQFTDTEKTKLGGIAIGATANATNAQLRDRGTHTGTQTASTISDFDGAADARIANAAGDTIAELDGSGKVPTSQLPAIAFVDVHTVASQAAQLALTAQEGDVAVRSDLNKSFIHNGGTAGTMADWTELLTPTDTVLSVNGNTGAVVITKATLNLGAVDNTSDADKPISTATQAALDLKATDADLDAHTSATNNPHNTTKAQVGLSAADNTSDADKPVSTAQQAALNAKLNSASNLSDLANAATARGNLGLGTIALLAAPAGDVVGTTDTQTLSNKRINKRAVTLVDGANIATNADSGDLFIATLGGNRTIDNPTGTPVGGQTIMYRFKQDATGSRTVSWASMFRFSADLPAPVLSTTANTTDYIGFMYNAVDTKWDCIAVSRGY